MDGMEVLRRVREIRPDIQIIIITAYGTIELAVEAMRLGAGRFYSEALYSRRDPRPGIPCLDREKLDEQKAADYGSSIELAKRVPWATGTSLRPSNICAKPSSLDPARPEGL